MVNESEARDIFGRSTLVPQKAQIGDVDERESIHHVDGVDFSEESPDCDFVLF